MLVMHKLRMEQSSKSGKHTDGITLEFTFLYNRVKSELCLVYANNGDGSQFA